MDTEKYYTLAKTALIIPFIAGLLTLAEQFLPLQKMETVVEYKHTSRSAKLGNTTYSIDFVNNNDQFTEAIYNQVNEGDEVTLQVLYFTKEVQTIQLPNGQVLKNDTAEIYFLIGFTLAFLGFSIYFWRKKYYTVKQYRYITILCLMGLFSLIRIINLNT
jgi:hypothetical protein